MTTKQFNCNDLVEYFQTKITNGELSITESDLMKELQEMTPINESSHNSIDESTALLEAIYNNMDKVLGE